MSARVRAHRPLRWLNLLVLLLSVVLGRYACMTSGPDLDLEVEVSGCDMVWAPIGEGGSWSEACELWGTSVFERARNPDSEGNLTVWAKTSSHADVVLALDGRWVEPLASKAEQGGVRMVITVEKGTRLLTVSAIRGTQQVERSLLIQTAAETQELQDLRQQIARRFRGEQVTSELDALLRSESPVIGAKALGQLARVVAATDVPYATTLLRDAMDMHHASGRISDEVGDGLFLMRVLLDAQHDVEAAAEVLERIAPLLDRFDEGEAVSLHYRALIAMERGDLGAALQLERACEQRSLRLDLEGQLADVYQSWTEILDDLGRYDESRDVVRDKLKRPPGSAPCATLAQYLTNLGWHRILAGDVDRAGAARDLQEARELFSKRCPDALELRNVLTNLAHLALDAGQLEQAAAYLGEARAAKSPAPAHYEAEWQLLAGRLALERHEGTAERLFRDVQRMNRVSGLKHYEIAATVGLAEALEAAGRIEEALAAYDEANHQLNQWSTLVPFGEGKQTFFLRHDRGVRRHLDLLLRLGQVRQAACVARRSMVRAVSMGAWSARVGNSAAKRAAWSQARQAYDERIAQLAPAIEVAQSAPDAARREREMTRLVALAAGWASDLDAAALRLAGAPPAPACDSLSPGLAEPSADEVVLVYHPVGNRWARIALTRESARAELFDLLPEEVEAALRADSPDRARWNTFAEKLIAPFHDLLADGGKRKLRIIAAEPLGSIDFADLPGASGTTLADRFSIYYGLDVSRAEAPSAAARDKARRALLVVPRSDLYMARFEADEVRDALERAGWRVTELSGSRARREAVREALEDADVDLFHYVGHGVARGIDGWESHLQLDGGDWLAVADVMTLARAPREVILASCSGAAPTGRSAHVVGPTLAGAFLAAGAERVLASPRPVFDPTTTVVMQELYLHHLPKLVDDPAAAVQDSLRALRQNAHRAPRDPRARPDLERVTRYPRLRVYTR